MRECREELPVPPAEESRKKTHLVLPVVLKVPRGSDGRFQGGRGQWPGWRDRGPGPPTGSTHHHLCREQQQQASKRSIVSPLGWKTQVQFPLRSTGRLFRACGGPGRGPPGWTGRPRLGPGCGSGCCRWRETVEEQIIN